MVWKGPLMKKAAALVDYWNQQLDFPQASDHFGTHVRNAVPPRWDLKLVIRATCLEGLSRVAHNFVSERHLVKLICNGTGTWKQTCQRTGTWRLAPGFMRVGGHRGQQRQEYSPQQSRISVDSPKSWRYQSPLPAVPSPEYEEDHDYTCAHKEAYHD